ncbi:MAG: ABC transporter permease [Treponema sp.]|nr:ABC transporter permease [Treponema sp.]
MIANALFDFFAGSFTSTYYFGTLLNTAFLLMASSLGDTLMLTTGEFNLGGEGQIYAGGFTAAVILAAGTEALPFLSPLILLLLALAAAMAVPACMMLVSALLKQLKNAHILLTSFLVSSMVIPFIDALIAGKFRGETNNLLATPFIAQAVRSPKIMSPSPLSAVALVPPLLCIGAWFVMRRTVLGRTLQITGISREFAAYCGFPQNKIMYGTLALSGALHGCTGFIAVVGTYYTCHAGFYSGMGWNALSCALIAQANPALLIPSSVFISWLFTSATRVALNNNFGFDAGTLIQGIIIFCIALRHIKRDTRTQGGNARD